jgi:HEAT repeat protein
MLRRGTLLGVVLLLAWCAGPTSAQPAPRFLKKTAAEWSAQLRDPNVKARRSAAFALGKLGMYAVGALPPLCKLYGKETDASVREAIIASVGEIAAESGSGNADLEKMLIDALQRDPDRLVRRSAACSLGQIASKSEAVRDALGQALSDPEQAVRQNAAWSLGQFDAKAAPYLVAALRDDSCDALVKRDTANALAAVSKDDPKLMRPALGDLLAMCRDGSPEVRKAALTPLVRIVTKKDAAALPVLKSVLRDPDTEVRRFAALALSNVGGKDAADAVPILLDSLRNGDAHLKRSAAVAMHNIGDVAAPAVPELIKALQDADPELRKNAALALGGIGKAAADAVPPLVQLVTHADVPRELRIEAAEAITRMGNIPAVQKQIPAVLKILGDSAEDGDVRVRLAWLFNDFVGHAPSMTAAKPVMDQVCREPGSDKNGSARYHCAYLMAFYYKQQTPDSALNVLGEWLKDDTGKLYGNKRSSAGVTGTEKKEDSNVAAILEGDSRTMAVDVLKLVGRDRVTARKDIIADLRRLAGDPKTYPELQTKCRTLLTSLGV